MKNLVLEDNIYAQLEKVSQDLGVTVDALLQWTVENAPTSPVEIDYGHPRTWNKEEFSKRLYEFEAGHQARGGNTDYSRDLLYP
jgi:hypothetical protein